MKQFILGIILALLPTLEEPLQTSFETATPPVIETYDIGKEVPNDRLQLVFFLDAQPTLSTTFSVELIDSEGNPRWFNIWAIPNWEYRISTAQINLNGNTPTGRYKIKRIIPDNDPNGMAVGALWKNNQGKLFITATYNYSKYECDTFVGYSPIEISKEVFAQVTPQLTTRENKEYSYKLIHAAQLLEDGVYHILWK
tara:strand:- start:1530 stop:2120 length:591 start_codon:yes stop_codon:yes gene_type:complete